MTCNTTELIDKVDRAARLTPGVSSNEDRAYALLTVAASYLGGDDAGTVKRIAERLARESHSDKHKHEHGVGAHRHKED